jgi:hypothetical protein
MANETVTCNSPVLLFPKKKSTATWLPFELNLFVGTNFVHSQSDLRCRSPRKCGYVIRKSFVKLRVETWIDEALLMGERGMASPNKKCVILSRSKPSVPCFCSVW